MAPTPPKITIRREPSRLTLGSVRVDRSQVLAFAATVMVASLGAFAIWTVLSRPADPADATSMATIADPQPTAVAPPKARALGDQPRAPERSGVAAEAKPAGRDTAASLLAACDVSPQRSVLDWIWSTGGVALIQNDTGLLNFVADPARWRSPEQLISPGELPAGQVSIRGIRLVESVTDEQVRRCVEAAPDLEALALAADHLGADSLLALRTLAQLREVHLDGLSATRLEMELIAEMPALRRLYLLDAKLPGDALCGLGRCRELEKLSLAEATFDPRQLSSLQSLPKLTQLDLSRTRVDDQALQALTQLKPLRRLQLDGSGLSPQALAGLRSAMPQCEVCPSDAERLDPRNGLWPQLTLAAP